jgi:restriction system protein
MSAQSEWASFYQTLNRLGPRLLDGVHPDLAGYIVEEARDTDSFWSGGIEADFDAWKEGKPKQAVRDALTQWVCNVQGHLDAILGPDSLIPFENLGITDRKRRELRASIGNIRLRLDEEHIHLFIDSVLLSFRSTPASAKLLIQGVVQSYGSTPDGKLIHAIAIPWRMIVDLLKKDWNFAYQIPFEKWEELVAAAFDRAGYDEVTLTPRSGDRGRDVIAVRKGIGSIRIIDSVKAYKPGHLVGHDDVRALAGVLLGDPQSSKGIVTTTSGFAPGIATDPFLKPLMPYRLELMDGHALQEWFQELALS